MGNPATAEIVELKTRTDEYYKRAWQLVEDMGYINPSKDLEDKRSIELTKLIQSERLEVQVVKGWDMSNFAPRTAKYYSDFQSRVDGEGDPHKWYYSFYKYEEPRKRIIFGTEINKLVYLSVGNERGRGHEFAINQMGCESKCDLVLFKHPEGTPLWKILKFANKLARRGNLEIDGTRPENKEDDLPHQLQRNFFYACQENPQRSGWTLAKKKQWGKNWIINEVDRRYEREEYKSFLGNVLNKAFSSDRSQPIPSADTEGKRKKLWKKFFPEDEWTTMVTAQVKPGVSEYPVMMRMPTHWQNFESQMYQTWKKSGGESIDVWLIARVGQTMESNISSVKSANDGRQTFIDAIQEYNRNKLLRDTLFPVIHKIVFEKQLSSEDNYAIAKEWHPQQKRFVDKI